jgi:hypothetical protein
MLGYGSVRVGRSIGVQEDPIRAVARCLHLRKNGISDLGGRLLASV